MSLILSEIDLINHVKSYDKIIICGAGAVGKKVHEVLLAHNTDILYFAVSRSKTKAKHINGIEVKEIKQLCAWADTALFVVAVRESLHRELLSGLREIEARNIIYVSDQMYMDIRMKYQRQLLKFQIHITEHCNLNCRGCYHFSSLAKEEFIQLDEYCSDLARLSELFDGRMEEILLLGGEPLLHPQMAEIIKATRRYFNAGVVKILSNGLPLCSMPEEFWDACLVTKTEIWLTKYPISLDYERIEQLAQSKGVEIKYFSSEPVRTLGHQPLNLEGTQDHIENFRNCYRANECVALDHGKLYACIIPAYVRHFNQYFDKNLAVCEQDYVDIYETDSKDEIFDKLNTPMPFCRYCDRGDISRFGVIPWQKTNYDISEWTI